MITGCQVCLDTDGILYTNMNSLKVDDDQKSIYKGFHFYFYFIYFRESLIAFSLSRL